MKSVFVVLLLASAALAAAVTDLEARQVDLTGVPCLNDLLHESGIVQAAERHVGANIIQCVMDAVDAITACTKTKENRAQCIGSALYALVKCACTCKH